MRQCLWRDNQERQTVHYEYALTEKKVRVRALNKFVCQHISLCCFCSVFFSPAWHPLDIERRIVHRMGYVLNNLRIGATVHPAKIYIP